MSRKSKPAEKRGQELLRSGLDFFTPLPVEECLDHLKSGHSPLPTYDVSTWIDGNRFGVALVDPYAPRVSDVLGRTPARGHRRLPRAVKYAVEGGLLPTENGLTRVTGQVVPDWLHTTAYNKMLMALCFVFALPFFLVDWDQITTTFALLWFAALAVSTWILLQSKIQADRRSAILLAWIEQRLDVPRTKRNKHDIE
jgi:hypothetical protein